MAAHSHFVQVGGHRWHVQEMGTGPTLLLLHGAGASTHSFRDLMPILARDYHCIAVDLPGQGFSTAPRATEHALPNMSRALDRLVTACGWHLQALIGHSAGVAVAFRLALQRSPPLPVISLNGSLRNFEGVAGWLYPLLAKTLVLNPFVPAIFAGLARAPGQVERLLTSTGSPLDAPGQQLYRALVTDRHHVGATLSMMARWDLASLRADLRRSTGPALFLTADQDRAVPPEVSEEVAAWNPNAQLITLTGLGHLAHEEAPDQIAQIIRQFLTDLPQTP